MSKPQAQKRADLIRAFRDELQNLEGDRILVLPDEQRARLTRYHDETLRDLAREFDVDTTDAQKQMSWGMRIASFLGALALCAAVVLFFYRFWGLLSTPVQVAILLAAQNVAVLGTDLATRLGAALETNPQNGEVASELAVTAREHHEVLGCTRKVHWPPETREPWNGFRTAMDATGEG